MNMNKLFGLAAAVILAALTLPASAQERIPTGSLKEEDLVFKSGETIDFTIHYKWGIINADVAKATFKVRDANLRGQDVFHASLTCKTQRFYEKLFLVKEDFDSWFTKDGAVPLKAARSALEGKYTATNDYTYFPFSENPYIDADVTTSRKGDRTATLPYDETTYDIMLMLCTLRNLDADRLQDGTVFPITLAIDTKTQKLRFTYYGKETKKIPGIGNVRCLKFGFQVNDGEVFDGSQDLLGWFSDDGNRIPVWFQAPLKVGEVQGRLRSYSGLKSDFTALLED